MADRIVSTATLQLTLHFPKSVTLVDVAPAYRSWNRKSPAELVAKVITCVATDKDGNHPFVLSDSSFLLQQPVQNVKEWFLIAHNLIKELNAKQKKSQSTESYRTSFSYPPGQAVFVKKDGN